MTNLEGGERPRLAALLFDLDGTMVDTDAAHLSAWNHVLADIRASIDHDIYNRRVMGFSTESVTETLFPYHGPAARADFAERKEARFRALAGELQPIAGLLAVLDRADAAGLALAVVTNAPRANALLLLRGIGVAERFPVLVIGEELARGKPDPLPYLTALEQLGVPAGRALAFEDSLSGVRAAVAAGIGTVGLRTALDDETLRAAGAFATLSDFADPALDALLREGAPGRSPSGIGSD